MTITKLNALACLLLLSTSLLIGCSSDSGPELTAVQGTITKDGSPFVGATLEFYPVGNGAASYGFSDELGKFTLRYSTGKPGAVPGEHMVTVIGGSTKGKAPETPSAEGELQPIANPSGGGRGAPKSIKGIAVSVTSDPDSVVKIEL